jgi:1-acyl-sn-glycerol-3-phosphate acyltransferase
MVRRRIEPLEPSEANARICDRNLRLMGGLTNLGLNLRTTATWSGQEAVPKDGAFLFLSNHVSLFDPMMSILATRRCIHYLATQSAMTQRLFGTVLRNYGSVPKKKFTSDAQAIRNLKRWSDLGRAVGLFPEGQRSWDGRLLEFIPGIETLVRLLNVPVVTFRVYNADRQWPRWAETMRRGRVHLEFDPPHSFDRKTPQKEVYRYIRQRLSVEEYGSPHWPVRGKNFAHGLSNPLFACPSCLAGEALRCDKDDAQCVACGKRWRISETNTMHGLAGAPSFAITEAIDRVHEHFAQHRVFDRARFGTDEVILESERMSLLDVTHDAPIDIGHGRLRLTPHRLELVDSAAQWIVPMSELRAVSVEMRRRLQFRTPDGLFEAVMPQESVVKWEWFTEHWRLAAQPKERAKLDKLRAKFAD